jgi:hypothetical protein
MNFEQIRRDLQWLRGEDGVVEPSVADDVLARILRPLLLLEGFDMLVRTAPGESDNGFDLEASDRNAGPSEIASIGIQYKHFGDGRRIGTKDVRSLIGSGLRHSHPRLIVLT